MTTALKLCAALVLAICALNVAHAANASSVAKSATTSTAAKPTTAALNKAATKTATKTKKTPIKALPADWHRGVFIEVFVRAWKDSNGDGIGDLRGLIDNLDYLQTLGVRGIWLMPITKSADRDHGYATTDFTDIEPQYGTLADFDELIRAAHERGIGIIMDYVVNHASYQHPLFIKARDPKSPYRKWFVWEQDKPAGFTQGWDIWGKNPWYQHSDLIAANQKSGTPTSEADAKVQNFGTYFGTFGPHMPDFNFNHPPVLQWHMKNIKFWLDRGIDGFRFDAIPHLVENSAKEWNNQPESVALMRQIYKMVHRYPNKYTVCEATATPIAWAAPGVCGSAFAFGLEQPMINAARGDAKAIEQVAKYFEQAPANDKSIMATMLANHDIFAGERIFDQLKGNEPQMKMAAATLLTLPGIPFLYYGEEIGMAGGKGLKDDPKLRIPMSWQPNEQNAGFTSGTPFRALSSNVMTNNAAIITQQPEGFFSIYRRLIISRTAIKSLNYGDYKNPRIDGQLLRFDRTVTGQVSQVYLNYGEKDVELTIEAPAQIAPTGRKRKIYIMTDRVIPGALELVQTLTAKGEADHVIPAQSMMVLTYE